MRQSVDGSRLMTDVGLERRWSSFAALCAAIVLVACSSRTPLPDPKRPLVPTPIETFRAKPPPRRTPPPISLPEVSTIRLANGLTVYVVEKPDAEVVALEVVVRHAGTDRPSHMAGVPSWVAQLLVEDSDALDFGVVSEVTADSAYFAASVVPRLWRKTVRAIGAAITKPRFTRETVSVSRLARARNATLLLELPSAAALLHARRRVDGARRALGANGLTHFAVLGRQNRETLLDAYRAWYSPTATALIVVGPIASDEVIQTARSSPLGAWIGQPHQPTFEPAKKSRIDPSIHFLTAPTLQAHLAIAHRAPSRRAPDHASFLVLHQLYCRLHTSRLNFALREARGHSYGVRCSYTSRRNGGILVVASAIAEDELSNELQSARSALRKLVTEPPTADELDRARMTAQEYARADLERVASLRSEIGDLFVHDLTPDHWRQRDRAIAAVSQDDVLRVAQRYLGKSSTAIVVAAATSVAASLQWTGLPVTYDPDTSPRGVRQKTVR